MLHLITGGAGFIGSHLAEALVSRGNAVTVLDDLSTGRAENMRTLEGKPGFRFVQGSVTAEQPLADLVAAADVIFHLAAAVGVDLIVKRPVHTIETNIHGTEIVLKLADRRKTRILLASTSEVYGKGTRVPFGEDDDCVLGPTSRSRWSYACSKAVDEFLALSYFKERHLPAVIARLFNTVGSRQVGQYGMVLPRFIAQARAGGPITVYGDGTQSRCFCDVADVVDALIRLSETPAATGQVFNVGSTDEITIHALAEKVRDRVAPRAEIVHVPYDKAYEAGFEDLQRRVPDITRIRRVTGWTPRKSLDDIIEGILAAG
ncbi:MAG: GDP-mannose 4,6-dehydratase [Planctomycetota bacterium]